MRIKNKIVISWSSRKKKSSSFVMFTLSEGNVFLTFLFHLNILHIKKHYFIDFCCLFFKLSKTFSVSLSFMLDLYLFILSFLCFLNLDQVDERTPEREIQRLSKCQQLGENISKNFVRTLFLRRGNRREQSRLD